MPFTIEKKVLYELLQIVFPVVPAKSSLQILSNLKFTLSDDKIEIIATDLDHSIKVIAPIVGEGRHEITVNARKLFEIVRELQDGEIKLSFDDQVLIIESGDSFSCKIACADSRDFPAFPTSQDTKEIDVSVGKIKNMIVKSSFAVSKDELKACLCGVLWEMDSDRTGMVATDGHRLGRMKDVQPKLEAIRSKYKNNPKKMNEQIMALYKKEGINPFNPGCLPMIMQMPVFISLFVVLNKAIELRGAKTFIMPWVGDLSQPEALIHLPFTVPIYGSNIALLPIIMAILTYFQNKATIKDPNQRMMIYLMPIMMLVLFNNFPAGLVLYWTFSSALQLLQQWIMDTSKKKSLQKA